MSTIKVLIKKAKPEKWYYEHIGKKLDVLENSISTPTGLVYLYSRNSKFTIDGDDCLTNIDLREKKLDRIKSY